MEPLTNWQDPRSRPCTATKIPVPCNLALLLLHYFYAPIANAFTKWLPLIFLSAENCPHFSDKTFLYLQLTGEIFRTPGAHFLPSSKRDYVPIIIFTSVSLKARWQREKTWSRWNFETILGQTSLHIPFLRVHILYLREQSGFSNPDRPVRIGILVFHSRPVHFVFRFC